MTNGLPRQIGVPAGALVLVLCVLAPAYGRPSSGPRAVQAKASGPAQDAEMTAALAKHAQQQKQYESQLAEAIGRHDVDAEIDARKMVAQNLRIWGELLRSAAKPAEAAQKFAASEREANAQLQAAVGAGLEVRAAGACTNLLLLYMTMGRKDQATRYMAEFIRHTELATPAEFARYKTTRSVFLMTGAGWASNLGERDTTSKLFEKAWRSASEIPSPADRIEQMNSICGHFWRATGNIPDLIPEFNSVLDRTVLTAESLKVPLSHCADCMGFLVTRQIQSGDYAGLILLAPKAISAWSGANPDRVVERALMYQLLSIALLSLGRSREGLDAVTESIRLMGTVANDVPKDSETTLPFSFAVRSAAYLMLRDKQRCIADADNAARLAHRLDANPSAASLLLISGLLKSASSQAKPELALNILASLTQHAGNASLDLAGKAMIRAAALLERGEYRKALNDLDRSRPAFITATDRQFIAIFHRLRAECWAKLGDLPRALLECQEGVKQFDVFQQQAIQPDEVGTLQDSAAHAYGQYASILTESKKPQDALMALEHGRAVAFARMSTLNSLPIRAIIGEDATRLRRAQAESLSLRRKVEDARMALQATPAKQARLHRDRAALLADLQLKEMRARNEHNELSRKCMEGQVVRTLARGREPTSFDVLANGLFSREGPDTLFLEFSFVTDDDVLLYALSKRVGLRHYRLSLKSTSLLSRLSDWRFRAQSGGSNESEERALFRDLDRVLLSQVRRDGLLDKSHVTALCIVADGPILDVPFPALMNDDGRYLIEDFAISTPVSLSSLVASRPSTETGFGFVAMTHLLDKGEGYDAARALPTKVARYFRHVKALPEPPVTREIVSSLAPAASLLHITAHGEVFPGQGMISMFLLAGSGPEDHGIRAGEIAELPLSADLAVLVACSAGGGAAAGGEGVLGLGWAFQAAGCRSVVAPLWDIDPKAASQLLESFYRELAVPDKKNAGQMTRLDVALQLAMKSMISTPGKASPRYWSAFRLSGSARPLRAELFSSLP